MAAICESCAQLRVLRGAQTVCVCLRPGSSSLGGGCTYTHRDICWGPLSPSNMVPSRSMGRFHAFTYFYAVCCFHEAIQACARALCAMDGF